MLKLSLVLILIASGLLLNPEAKADSYCQGQSLNVTYSGRQYDPVIATTYLNGQVVRQWDAVLNACADDFSAPIPVGPLVIVKDCGKLFAINCYGNVWEPVIGRSFPKGTPFQVRSLGEIVKFQIGSQYFQAAASGQVDEIDAQGFEQP